MNKLIAFFLSLLVGSTALAQPSFRYTTDATTVIYATDGQYGAATIDNTGKLLIGAISPGTGATNLGKAEDAVHVTGDTGVEALGVANTNSVTLCAEGDYCPVATGVNGAVLVDVKRALQVSDAGSLLKAEDSVAASGDAGVMSLGIRNEGGSTYADSNGDYSPIATGRTGSVYVAIDSNFHAAQATNILKLEDSIAGTGDALVGVAAVTNENLGSFAGAADNDYNPIGVTRKGVVLSSLVVDTNLSPSVTVAQSEDVAIVANAALVKVATQRNDALALDTDTTGDAQPLKGDALGRTITTLAPAGETFSVCSDYETGVADNVIKAAVTLNRIYITSLSCVNTAAVSSTIAFRDNTTLLWQGAVTSSTLAGVGQFNMTFPVPLRGSVNTVFQYLMGTTATNTSCCASGYISVN